MNRSLSRGSPVRVEVDTIRICHPGVSVGTARNPDDRACSIPGIVRTQYGSNSSDRTSVARITRIHNPRDTAASNTKSRRVEVGFTSVTGAAWSCVLKLDPPSISYHVVLQFGPGGNTQVEGLKPHTGYENPPEKPRLRLRESSSSFPFEDIRQFLTSKDCRV